MAISNYNDLIGLEVEEATKLLVELNIPFKLNSYNDRKSPIGDKQLVVKVNKNIDYIELIICNFKFNVEE